MNRRSEGEERGDRLSSLPETVWPDAVVYHGFRLLLLVAIAIGFTLLFPPDPAARVQLWQVGTVAQETIIAETPFSVPLRPDELRQARAEARASVPPTFDYRPEAADSMAARIGRLLDQVQAAALTDTPAAAVHGVLTEASIDLTPEQIALLIDPETFRLVRRTAERAALQILPEGVADGADLSSISTDRVTVRDPGAGAERSVEVSEILSAREFFDRSVRLLPATASPDAEQILRLLLIQNLEFSYQLNLQATEQDREGAERAVPTTKQEVLADEAIVRANEVVTSDVQERLEAYRSQLRAQGRLDEEGGLRLSPLVGQTILNLLLLAIFGLLVHYYRPAVYLRARWILLVAILIGVYAGGVKIVVANGWPVEAIPIAFVALTVAVLWDGRMALVLGLALAALTSIQPGLLGTAVLVPTALGGATAALAVRAVRRRSQAWIFIAVIAGAYVASLVGLGLVNGFGGSERVIAQLVSAGANTILSTLLAMGFLPVFEVFTGITTDQTLLEWADPNRPLLKRLSMEAPGTYAHTINVANLGEAAATAIGANGLLCRVGLYYHDVGKMLKPHYFVENQPDGRNPHDKLRPDTSATIVKEHVTEGLRLVREAKVPGVVAAFVGEHHGTQQIGFFWDAAVEEFGEENLDIDDFTYPGPRPRTRETAIAMLADSVESATRTLKDPTPERIRDLIDSVVGTKITHGQLDEAPLTLAELTTIKDHFVKVLGGVYHHRIDYPETRHLTNAPESAAADDSDAAGRGSTGEGEAEVIDAGGTGDTGTETPA
ncbi:MAG: HDIG domain-containing protein [Longimicrobiales bacterium]|nr:HDIG domain-containing protein [Longimicrobiales bacterium]